MTTVLVVLFVLLTSAKAQDFTDEIVVGLRDLSTLQPDAAARMRAADALAGLVARYTSTPLQLVKVGPMFVTFVVVADPDRADNEAYAARVACIANDFLPRLSAEPAVQWAERESVAYIAVMPPPPRFVLRGPTRYTDQILVDFGPHDKSEEVDHLRDAFLVRHCAGHACKLVRGSGGFMTFAVAHPADSDDQRIARAVADMLVQSLADATVRRAVRVKASDPVE
jgi:hypothetical protein